VIDDALLNNENKGIYADSAYRSKEIEDNLKENNLRINNFFVQALSHTIFISMT